MEMGGKNALIVLQDASLDLAVTRRKRTVLVYGAGCHRHQSGNCGRKKPSLCFVARLTQAAARWWWGNGLETAYNGNRQSNVHN